MNEQPFTFKTQLSVGDTGEQHFSQSYSRFSPMKPDDRRYDFILFNSSSVEVKTDTYDMNGKLNFFLEYRCGSKAGGPWRSVQDKVTFFVYYFIKNNTYYWFNPQTMCEVADKFIRERKPKLFYIKNVDNYGNEYGAEGYAIPRAIFDKVLLRRETL